MILRVLFDKLGSHVLARRISSRRLRQEQLRETPRVPAARSRLLRSVRPRVFGAERAIRVRFDLRGAQPLGNQRDEPKDETPVGASLLRCEQRPGGCASRAAE